MESSLCTPWHATVTGAHAGLRRLVLVRASTSALTQAARWRALAVRAQASAPEPERLSPAKGGVRQAMLPRTALRVGAGVALALALGGASWSARSGGAGAGAVLVQPVTVCTLNAVTDGAERGGSTPAAAAATVLRTSVDALSDSLFRREEVPRDRATLMDLVFEQVTKEHIGDRGKLTSLLQKEWSASRDSERKLNLGLLLTDVLINQREWQRAKEVCQQLTGRYQRDSRPYLHLAVINMMMAVETMLSPETATAEDIEKMSKNAMDAWKDFKNKYELAKGSTESST
ncbi:hypothetical protein ACQ4PT_032838 [Festuca glaucescens]